MGAPSAPTIVQQKTAPTADEKQAAIDANQQKTAALLKINQDVFARSQGLRGAASMYDWAGPTPFLAGPHVAGPTGSATAKPPAKAPGWQDFTTIGGGKGPTRLGPTADEKVITGFNYGTGPRGDRDVGFQGYGGSPRNTGWVPPSNPARPSLVTPGLGPPGDRDPAISGGVNAANLNFVNAGRAKLGLAPVAAPKPINPLQYQQTSPLTGKPMVLQPSQHPVGAPLPPRYATPPSPGLGQLRVAAGLPAQKPGSLYAPAPVRAAAAAGNWQALPGVAGPAKPAPAPKAPISTPAPKAPAVTAAAPLQPLAQPAPVAAAKPPPAPPPAATLGGVARPAVYANPNLKTVAPLPRTSLIAAGSPRNR
jgi:hypothetical protein